MASTTVMAVKTCQKLIGREWKEDLLQEACRLLAEEMNLSLRPWWHGGFRRTLVLSFFFKFYLTVLQKHIKLNGNNNLSDLVPCMDASATELFNKDPVSNAQLFQASGEAVYCDDIPSYTNELYLTLVTSSKAHAKIISIDTTEAQNVPGFVCFVSDQDVPGSNTSGICNDETIFAKDIVRNYCFSSTNCPINLKDTKMEQSSHLHYSSILSSLVHSQLCSIYFIFFTLA
ncbi:hypothetical protein E2320_022476 [Naja naja]|nr:hypothetical protein E2320_022476 [Naja naja]